MKLSIITPSFNNGKFLECNIKSVMDQDYQNVEHIIYDNKSTDETHDIIKRYKNLQVYVEKDFGQSDALNKALSRCTGDIIGWLNADDYYSSNIFNYIIELFKNNKNLDAIYGNFNLVDENANFIRTVYPQKFMPKLLPFRCYIPSTSFFFKSSEIKKHNIIFDKELYYRMDQDFYCKMIQKKLAFYKIDKTFGNMTVHRNAKTAFKLNNNSQIKFNNEGIDIINKYSSIVLPKNYVGIFLFSTIMYLLDLWSFCYKKLT